MNIHACVAYLRPTAQFKVNANDYNQLEMLDGTTKPTLAELENTWPSVSAEIERRAFNATLLTQITALDSKRIRPLAEGDSAYLSDLNRQIQALRAKMK